MSLSSWGGGHFLLEVKNVLAYMKQVHVNPDFAFKCAIMSMFKSKIRVKMTAR